MRYYTKGPSRFKINHGRKKNTYFMFLCIILLFAFLNIFFYLFDKRVLPTALSMAEVKLKGEAINIINEESVNVYSEDYNYEDLIKIEKDAEGNITLIRADTVLQNYLASQVVLRCNERLNDLEEFGTKVPIGYLTNNSFFYQMGPEINIKLKRVGNINTSYESIFESAGINQTRHKIYLNVEMKMRVIVTLKSKDVDVTCQIPVSETIIVGKIPDTAINLNGSQKSQ